MSLITQATKIAKTAAISKNAPKAKAFVPKVFGTDTQKAAAVSADTEKKKAYGFLAELFDGLFKQQPKKPLSEKDLKQLRGLQGGIIQELMMNSGKYMLGKSSPALIENFAAKKSRLVSEFSKTCDKSFVERVQKAKTPEQITQLLLEKEFADFKGVEKMLPKKKKITLETEQILYNATLKRANYILAREKALHVPSTKPQVIAIENILKEQYGAKFVSLKDDEEIAKRVLKAFETAKKNGVNLPKNVIVSDFMMALGEHLNNDTIMLASKTSRQLKKELEKNVNPAVRMLYTNLRNRLPNTNLLSTRSDYHTVLHEILHGEHLPFMAFSKKKIPDKYKDVKLNLSAYSALSCTHETFTELNTKRLIDGLSPKEQELYDYLNFYS